MMLHVDDFGVKGENNAYLVSYDAHVPGLIRQEEPAHSRRFTLIPVSIPSGRVITMVPPTSVSSSRSS